MIRTTVRPGLALLLLLGCVHGAAAQIGDLSTLKRSRARADLVADSLQGVRVRYIARKESLSTRVDSLRSEDAESTQLRRAQLESRFLLARLLDVESNLDSLAALTDSLDEELRTSYDWEIARLFALLEREGWDDGLYGQLLVFQGERQELGIAIGPSQVRLADEHALSLSADDGPEEIQQKIELAQYKVAEVQQEWNAIARRLGFLERQLLLMKQFWYRGDGSDRQPRRDVNAQLRLQFEDHDGSLLVDSGQPPDRREARAVPPPDSVAPVPVEAPLLLEAQVLKAQQHELRELEAFYQDRIGTFHERMASILAGGG